MEDSKKNKIWMIISIVALVAIIVLAVMLMNNNKGSENKLGKTGSEAQKADIKIRKSETETINYTEFNNGLFKMKIPEGWKVDVLGDYIHYTIKVYDPQRPTYQ